MGMFDLGRNLIQAATLYDAEISYYQRSTKNTVTLKAKLGKSHTVSNNIDGFLIHEVWIDFIVPYSALGFMPVVGDTITYNNKRYAVSAPSAELCYRWHVLNESLRIHAQEADSQ